MSETRRKTAHDLLNRILKADGRAGEIDAVCEALEAAERRGERTMQARAEQVARGCMSGYGAAQQIRDLE